MFLAQRSFFLPTITTVMDESKHASPPPEMDESNEELFQIIDETGEGFGFDLTPEALAKPLAIGGSALFGFGMLAGVPFGLAMGRTQESKGVRTKPTLDGLKFAATTFGLGTLLCASLGIAGFYGIKAYYNVESFDEFGRVMREAVPARRKQMESSLGPVLDVVRRNAGDNLPEPAKRFRDRLGDTRLGKWIKEQVHISTRLPDTAQDNAAGGRLSNGSDTTPTAEGNRIH